MGPMASPPRIKLPEQVLFALVEDAAGDVYSVRRRDLEEYEVLDLLKPEIHELHLHQVEETRRTAAALRGTSKPPKNRLH